jgi:hypothetical protein
MKAIARVGISRDAAITLAENGDLIDDLWAAVNHNGRRKAAISLTGKRMRCSRRCLSSF